MSQKYEKLKTLLKELFQLDQPDLDFGLYRIMHAKSGEITQFLDKDLLPQVRKAFEEYKPADKAAMQIELNKVVAGIKDGGMDPEQSPKVQELRQKINDESVDIDALENEVYDHLFSFFRRYYSEGDYMAKRVYKPGVYAIPYEGEEVKLHWANRDQYYIKTSEYLKDYTFTLKPHNEKNPMRVHFKLVAAAEGEHGNIKAGNNKERRFILTGEDFIAEEDGELVIRFEYRSATLADWPEERREQEQAKKKPKPPKQGVLSGLAIERILAIGDKSMSKQIDALAKKAPTESNPERTVLEKHLSGYTDRHTFDYFIHKDLDGFLSRELDFYIKNEVMHLDDVESESAPRVEQYLSKIKVVRRIAQKIIAFLVQIENFQKKLWLKKKFVVDTNYCITLDRIPEEFYPEIVKNETQCQEWVRLFVIDEIDGKQLGEVAYSVPLTIEFLQNNKNLVLDTIFFSDSFKDRLIEAADYCDNDMSGCLIHSDNFHALRLLSNRYRSEIGCIYIDPPFNSPSSEIVYKNNYKHSSFLTLMNDRLEESSRLLTHTGSTVVAIDENEGNVLLRLIDEMNPNADVVNVTVEHNRKGIQGDHFSYTHEYAIFVVPMGLKALNRTILPKDEWEYPNLRNWGGESERHEGANCFYPIYIKNDKIVGFGEVCDEKFHPDHANVPQDDGTIAIYPIDDGKTERKWRYARNTVEGIQHLLKIDTSRGGNLQIMKAKADSQFKTVWRDPKYNAGDYGTKVLTNMGFSSEAFDFPKSIFTVKDCIYAVSNSKDTILDYFAGSGTTAHAIMKLNREDEGRRKYILVEMGAYFDVLTKPRVLKSIYADTWKDGKPVRTEHQESQFIKYIRLESYDDALNNLEIKRDTLQENLLSSSEAAGAGGLAETYRLRYMLDVESRDSQSLLNIAAFVDPTAYRLNVKNPGSDESQELNIDLLETFNYLVGLTVQHIAAPQTFKAEFKRDSEERLQIKGRIKEDSEGPFWFRTVDGTTPDGKKTLIIWRKLTGDPEQDNLVLDAWFTKQGYSTKDYEFSLIYVNGDNNLENLKQADDTWKVRLIEEDFHRLMFDTGGL